jgi:hypothetical protein
VAVAVEFDSETVWAWRLDAEAARCLAVGEFRMLLELLQQCDPRVHADNLRNFLKVE